MQRLIQARCTLLSPKRQELREKATSFRMRRIPLNHREPDSICLPETRPFSSSRYIRRMVVAVGSVHRPLQSTAIQRGQADAYFLQPDLREQRRVGLAINVIPEHRQPAERIRAGERCDVASAGIGSIPDARRAKRKMEDTREDQYAVKRHAAVDGARSPCAAAQRNR
jgi:hypothetical protein